MREREIVKLYRKGKTPTELSLIYKISVPKIMSYIRRSYKIKTKNIGVYLFDGSIRNRDMLKLFIDGYSFREIGKKVGLSNERVRQILIPKITIKEKEQHFINKKDRGYKLYIRKNMNKVFSKFGMSDGRGGNYWEKKAYEAFLIHGFNVIVFGGSSIIDFVVNGYRVDVKGAFVPQVTKKDGVPVFEFRSKEHQRKYVEFYVCCFNYEGKDYFYIIPNSAWNAEIITITPKSKLENKYKKYLYDWNQLQIPG